MGNRVEDCLTLILEYQLLACVNKRYRYDETGTVIAQISDCSENQHQVPRTDARPWPRGDTSQIHRPEVTTDPSLDGHQKQGLAPKATGQPCNRLLQWTPTNGGRLPMWQPIWQSVPAVRSSLGLARPSWTNWSTG